MKKLLFSVVLLSILAASGCALVDYPVITDDRGSFSGIVRTGHKAYVIPTGQVATSWPDGSDELFTLVSQNAYGDQKLYTFNNYDPTNSVQLMDQTYCDWRYDGCEITRAWNPANAAVDNPYDYEFFPDCSGARSLSLLVGQAERVGECGDSLFRPHAQEIAAEFSNLATTTWRGSTAYVLPINAGNTLITLSAGNGTSTVPVYGQFNGFVTEQLALILPMTPNARHELRWLSAFAGQNKLATASITYGSLNMQVNVALATDGINYNLGRF